MKRSSVIIALAILADMVLLSGCQKEPEDLRDESNLHEMTFHAGWADDTKTILQEDGKSIWWSPGDELSIFVGSGTNGGYKFTSTVAEESATATFSGKIEETEGTYYALYPYDANAVCDKGTITTTIPSKQIAREGSFGDGAFLSVAVSDDNNLYFRNICSGIKFSVTHDNIRKIVVASADGTNIVGKVSITVSDPNMPVSSITEGASAVTVSAPDGESFKTGSYYYISLCPGTHNDGLVIKYYDTDNRKFAIYSISKSVTFNRAVVKRMEDKDKDLTFHYISASPIESHLLPDNVDKATVTGACFFVESDKTTDVSIPTYYSTEPIYYELDGTVAKYYTAAESFELTYPSTMFSGWSSLKQLDLSCFRTDKVSSFCQMFNGCSSLEELNVSSFNTENCTDFGDMFARCSSLKSVDVSNFNTANALRFDAMFQNCKNLKEINVLSFNTENATVHGMFGGCASLSSLDLSSFNLKSVTSLGELFNGCENLSDIKIDFSTVDPQKLLYLNGMFGGCKKLESVDLSELNTSNVRWMDAMFRQCVNLKSVNFSGVSTSKVERMQMMFESCCSLESLDLSAFNTSSVTDMSSMFDGCSKLKKLDLSAFDTGKVTNMSCMFRSCRKLAELNMSGFSAASLTNATEMFCFDFKLSSLNMGSFDLSSAEIATSGSLTSRDSDRCNVKCISETKNALINKSSGFDSDVFVWYGESEELPEYKETKDSTLYYSSDYSKDGVVKVVQATDSGAGLDMVLMGDGYSDRMIADGTYDRDMQKTIDAIFSFEPYKTLRELINIYIVYAVSENEIIGRSTALATYAVRSGYGAIGTDDVLLYQKYARKATSKWDFREVAPIVVLNSDISDGAVWTTLEHAGDNYESDPNWDDYHGGKSVAFVSGPGNPDFEYTVRHECGHSIGQLADEYVTYDSMDEYDEQALRWGMNYGQWKNIDFTSDPSKIKWCYFISDERYSNSGIGVFEGAKFATGVWRPTENSIMRDDASGSYNPPSRQAIYYRINKIAYGKGWQFDYETFVQQDLKNILPATKSVAKHTRCKFRENKSHIFKMEHSLSVDGGQTLTIIMD